MKTYSGFTESTAENLILDAGAFFMNYDMDFDTPDTAREKLLGATRGGGQFIAKPTIRLLEIDGVKGAAKGLEVLESWDVSIEANMLELAVDTLKLALVSGDIDTTSNPNYDIVTARNDIELTDYIDNITWIGTQSGSNKPVVIQIFNALSKEGLTLQTQNKDEAVVKLIFAGHYEGEDLQTPPFKIYYPKISGDTTPPTVTVEPFNEETDVDTDTTVVWTFSETIRQASVNPANLFVMANGVLVDGSLSISPNKKVVTFTPTAELDNSATYMTVCTTNVKDVSGNSIEAALITSFTTKDA